MSDPRWCDEFQYVVIIIDLTKHTRVEFLSIPNRTQRLSLASQYVNGYTTEDILTNLKNYLKICYLIKYLILHSLCYSAVERWVANTLDLVNLQ